MRRAARVDQNQAQVISALRAAGASVEPIGLPVDLLVGIRGVTMLMEVKNPDSRYGNKGANENQRDFMATWNGGTVALVDGVESALRALRVISEEQKNER